MNRSAVLVFAAVVSVIYGLGLIFAPATINEMHGIASNSGTSLMSRYFGAALLGIGVMAWLAREASDSDAMSALLQGAFVLSAIGLIISVHAIYAGVMNAVGWVPVIIQVVLTIGFGYHAFMRRQ